MQHMKLVLEVLRKNELYPTNSIAKDQGIKWTSEAQEAFDKLQQAMMTLPFLALPNFNMPFEIETYALGFGIWVVLIQAKRPIAYYSHTLAMRDRAKPVYERELLAVVPAVQRWRQYLLGRKFIVKTDLRSLKFLLEQLVIQPQYHKWIVKLLGYSFEVIYKLGLENKAADALSRMPLTVHLYNLTSPTHSFENNEWKAVPEEVYGYLKEQSGGWDVLIGWKGLSRHVATWECYEEIHQRFSELQLENKLNLEME
ncbi:transposon Tf2-1 polyprotein isoform X1 [Cucumis melo var. makuwa]|uniref:Transposon Tf2-1 polyprotein isoform X1 n=1 Tax=Cucumis melo var. makuwa TaxID=1194695 RepID=A0A5A7SU51_CUCMM|nr:transposon Tf2-1 polyprotein isoform X1 [Cucumis melo var. makuwa]TYK30564.1 transposon Tf2-1 polyprotein isoform X1 [Cucumis melo var. makuwa]